MTDRPRRHGNRRAARLFIGLGLALMLAAGALLGYNLLQSYNAGRAATAAAAQLAELTPPAEELPLYQRYPDLPMPVVTVDGVDYVGRLEIPDLELTLSVCNECDLDHLALAPCRYSGSAYKDDLVLAAHNFASHFGLINTLEQGALIIFTDMDGNEFRYTAEDIEILPPTAVAEMKRSPWDLTLFTCTWGGASRVTVRAARIED